MGHLYFRALIFSTSQIMKEKIIAKALKQIQPFNSRFKFLSQITCLGIGILQSCENLNHCPIRNKFFIYR